MSELQATEPSVALDDYVIEARILADAIKARINSSLTYINTTRFDLQRHKAAKLPHRTANPKDRRRLLEYRAHRLTMLTATTDDRHPAEPILRDLPPDPAANHPWWWHATLDLLAESPDTAHSAPELHRRMTHLRFSVARTTLAQRLATAARASLIDRPSRGQYRTLATAT